MNKKISRILRTNITLFSLCLVAFVLAAIPVCLVGEWFVIYLAKKASP